MSSSELAEAGVLGLEDYLVPAESDNLSESRSTASQSETKASGDAGDYTQTATGADMVAFPSHPDLLTELRKVHILDELIMEEHRKIHELQCHKEKPNEDLCGSKHLDTNRLPNISKEREAFRLQLEKEKSEVDKLEKSLLKESKGKKQKDRARKVVKCSIMEKAGSEIKEDRALCEELLSGSNNKSHRTHSEYVIHSHSQAQDTCETEHIQADLGPDVIKECTPQGLVPLPELPDSQYEDHCSEAEPSVFNRTTLITTSDLMEPPEEVVIQPQGCVYEKEFDRSGENATICKPEASLTLEMRPDDGAFDPGGKTHLPPVPKPRKTSLPVNYNPTEHETPHSTELQILALSSASQHPGIVQLDLQDEPLDEPLPETVTSVISHSLVLNANVKEHSNNNNNNHVSPEKCDLPLVHLSEITSKDEEDHSVVPACLLQTDLDPAEKIQTLSPVDECPHQQSEPPVQSLDFDPSGRDEQFEVMPDGVQSSEVMRASGSGSPGIQAQLNINMREVHTLSCGNLVVTQKLFLKI